MLFRWLSAAPWPVKEDKKIYHEAKKNMKKRQKKPS